MIETFGRRRIESFAKYDRPSRSWKTYRDYDRGSTDTLVEYSETWPKQGIMRSGIVSRLPDAVPLTSAKDYGSSRGTLTPTVGDSKGSRNSTANRSEGHDNHYSETTLVDYVTMYPTPSAEDSNPRGIPDDAKLVRTDNGTVRRIHNEETGKTSNLGLARNIEILDEIPADQKMWPTPSARDHKDTGETEKLAKMKERKKLPYSVAVAEMKKECPVLRGSLNPQFSAWLMGFPIGWTDCERSEMRRSRTRWLSHGRSLVTSAFRYWKAKLMTDTRES